MHELHSGQMDLWFSTPEEISDEGLLLQYRNLLTIDEQLRGDRFHFAKDRRRHLVTRALVRTVLSRYAPVQPQDWSFVTGENGKPRIANSHPLATTLVFNISHTQGLIVLGVRRSLALGVDVENTLVRRALLDVADHYFCQSEVDALVQLPQAEQQVRFFQLWTLKESYLKARGLGIFSGLNQFGFSFLPDNQLQLTLSDSMGDSPARWGFWQFKPSEEHVLSICAELNSAHAPLDFTFRRVIPFDKVEQLQLAPVVKS